MGPIIWLLILFCDLQFATVKCVSKPKSGPFVSNLVRVEKCKAPRHPYDPDPPGDVTAELYSTSTKKNLLRGNYTALRPDASLKLSVQDYFLVNGSRQMIFGVKNLSCRSQLVAMMGKVFGVSFNKKTCSVPKGTYLFSNIDYDFVDHVYTLTRDYGTVLRIVEGSSKRGTMVCLEFEVVVTPKSE
ncbi:uncharacterized protein [Choristoneura fumiferana]|uniref:uncharacterized protein n=1 Tax=Choristoneura fumiferana TaxID=7141 RepID=UPI003D15A209